MKQGGWNLDINKWQELNNSQLLAVNWRKVGFFRDSANLVPRIRGVYLVALDVKNIIQKDPFGRLSNILYTGHSTNLHQRFKQHTAGNQHNLRSKLLNLLNHVQFHFAVFDRHTVEHLKELEQNLIDTFNPQINEINSINSGVKVGQPATVTIKEETILDKKTTKILEKEETQDIEFKATFSVDTKTGKKKSPEIRKAALSEICGFLNTNNGVLLIGVQDSKNRDHAGDKISGIEEDAFTGDEDSYSLQLMEIARKALGAHAASQIEIKIEKIGQKHVCRINCKKSRQAVYCNYQGKSQAFIRIGTSTVEPSNEEWIKWCSQHFRN